LPPGTVGLEQVADPHDLADLDLVIDWGRLGVAENGAIWVDDVGVRQRVVHFITQHLLILLATADIVHHMHHAYERLSDHRPSFGMFLAGPSKTADIEQSLVLGAHGSRTLHVVVVQ
jgi:L-lactate dehydrogenase complex protein LldG